MKKINFKVFCLCYLALVLIGIFTTFIRDSISVSSLPVNKKHIIIDAGHGGADPGKVQGDINEKDINLEISNLLCKYLQQSGAIVFQTRADDTALDESKRRDLKLRRQLVANDEVDMLISIHQNSFPKESVRGAQVFYNKNSEASKELAEFIQKRLKEVADTNNTRLPKANNDYYILKDTDKASVIVECGFLSNPEEKQNLLDEEYQERLAWAIYMGILDYFGDSVI